MNYIAHIHIGAHTKTNLLGNFLGDFVKGSQLTHLPFELEQGIRLHRSVDVFTDSHPLIIEAKQLFPRDIRRMAGVVLDIYFDYLLMSTWAQYSNTDFNSIFNEFYLQLEQFSLPKDPYFSKLSEHLITHQWLNKYMKLETCLRAFLSIENRLNNKVIFADKAQLFLHQNSEFLESRFHQFYPECLEHGMKYIQSYK
ncbi:acyl carrier protein phosphodiesterase [Paraglaciecola arctica]|uniref:Acyl carrier protein phosphodiesterase n=1 Tax=Paraglaciecola arctica BSs20135 TaxID=493475 RepID=K6XMK5_9ALTE|nr:ACP phosphodiesterase [Paraglaciecola arctica]GAC21869.1 acyl carrier protein phosphodiesterase [Paraglaciecola arctica BSs20135]